VWEPARRGCGSLLCYGPKWIVAQQIIVKRFFTFALVSFKPNLDICKWEYFWVLSEALLNLILTSTSLLTQRKFALFHWKPKNGSNPKSCLGQVFNSTCVAFIWQLLELKTRPSFCVLSSNLNIWSRASQSTNSQPLNQRRRDTEGWMSFCWVVLNHIFMS